MRAKEDCFAFKRNGLCTALTKMNCDNCRFYKKAGTQCDTCKHKGTISCRNCYGKKKVGLI